VSVQHFLAGQSLYAGTRTRLLAHYHTGQLNLNLPHTHLFLLPLARLSPQNALILWTATSALVFGWSTWRSLAALRWHLPVLAWLALAVYLLAWGPAAAVSLTAQLSLLLTGVVTAAWLAARGHRRASAGAWLGLAAALKPFLLLFLPYFALKRDWRALGACLAVIGTICGLGVLVFGIDAYRDWYAQLPRISWGPHYFNASFRAAAERLFGRSSYGGLGQHPWVVGGIAGTASVVVGLATLASVAPRHRELAISTAPARVDHEWAALLLAALLISPLGWAYYVWIALWPVAATIGHVQPWRSPRRVDLLLIPGLAGWLWFGKMSEWGQPSPLATLTAGSMYFWALLALWLWTVGAIALDTRRSQTETDCSSPI
jgi:hypothetical protein